MCSLLSSRAATFEPWKYLNYRDDEWCCWLWCWQISVSNCPKSFRQHLWAPSSFGTTDKTKREESEPKMQSAPFSMWNHQQIQCEMIFLVVCQRNLKPVKLPQCSDHLRVLLFSHSLLRKVYLILYDLKQLNGQWIIMCLIIIVIMIVNVKWMVTSFLQTIVWCWGLAFTEHFRLGGHLWIGGNLY